MKQTTIRYVATPQLRLILGHQGRTAAWAARIAGVSRGTMAHVLAGQRTVNADMGRRLTNHLGLPFDMLFTPRERE